MSKFNCCFSYKSSTALALCLLLAVGCGQKSHQDQTSESMVQALMLLDQRNFDGAIAKYEEIIKDNPANEEAKIKLFHAYAGAGGFEALTLVDVLKTAEDKLTEIKNREKSKLESKISQKETEVVDNSLDQLEQVLIKVPTLSAKQKINLNKAICLYEELGLKIETAGKYNNFKWGTLHAFRLAVNLKEIIVGLKNSKDENQKYNLKVVEKILLYRGKEMGTDIYQVIKLYSHSYEKFKLIHEKVESLIGKTLKNPDFKFKINDLAKSEKEFYESFLKENIKVVSQIVNQYVEAYQNEIKRLVSVSDDILPPEVDVEHTRVRLQALITLAVRLFTIDQPDIEVALKELFSAETKQELYQALINSIKSESTSPLKEFLLANDGKLKSVITYVKLLLNDINEDGVADEIKNELNALKAKVNEELLKEELEKTNQAIKLAEEAVKEQTELMNEMDKALLEAHRASLNERIQEIEEYLKSPLEELNSALKSKIVKEDQNQIDKILKSVFRRD